jgi:hypothetical protein
MGHEVVPLQQLRCLQLWGVFRVQQLQCIAALLV